MRRIVALVLGAGLIFITACDTSNHTAPNLSSAPTATSMTRSSPPSSPTTTPSPTATTPVLTGAGVTPGDVAPSADRRFLNHDQGGAIAFAGYFYRALDWSIATTNPNLLRPISASTCTACQQYIHDLDTLAARGGHLEGGRIHPSAFAPVTGTLVPAEYVVEVTITQDASVVVEPSEVTTTSPAEPGSVTTYFYMRWNNGSWQALELSHVS